ncbi:MAG: Fe-S oxidoreductase [Myxococcaceae bacterium]|nr:Fe-S oxidoreductase [Myxococcaceae bacterium]
MLSILVAALGAFAWSASRRWQLLRTGRPEQRLDRIPDRLKAVWRYAFVQEKMDYYQPSGVAHKLIFAGFIVLLLRSLILWGRGFYAPFNFWIFAPWMTAGKAYEFMKDLVALGVLVGVAIFYYYRVIKPLKRISRSFEGTLILCIIATMMIADMAYDGAAIVLAAKSRELLCDLPVANQTDVSLCNLIGPIAAPYGAEIHEVAWNMFPSPAGSFFAVLFKSLPPSTLVVIAHIGFWTHSTLVLVFLNLLPHSKHFHVITAIPNVFLRDLNPPGRLAPMVSLANDPSVPLAEGATAPTYSEKLMSAFEKVAEAPDPAALPFGIARVEHFTWKAILDFYTCTECGRCSDNCPAHKTGKILSPKHLTLDLRNHLLSREKEFLQKSDSASDAKPDFAAATPGVESAADATKTDVATSEPLFKPIDLVANIIHPDVLWACTTCRACEEQCPVMISYVDKIVDMRRNLVMVKSEFPHELQKPFQAMEVNGNPWNLARMDRGAWSDGLGIATMAEKPTAEVLFWVGCAASYDDRAKKIARATAKLLKQAGVDFAILASEENCTGDPARRAGNEVLFAMLADGNIATLNCYKEQGGMKQVITTCPHCFNTLKNEYPELGAKLEVIHHTDFLLGLLAEKKLVPTNAVEGKVVYHDSCYLGRYNNVYESPREILRRIPGVELVEPEYWTKQRGLCCGAGGAQMWMEEQNKDRVNVKRTLQLIDAFERDGVRSKAVATAKPAATNGNGSTNGNGANGHTHDSKTIASACPFCMTMLTDGIKSQNVEDQVKQMDVSELLEKSCRVEEAAPAFVPEAIPEPAPAGETATA